MESTKTEVLGKIELEGLIQRNKKNKSQGAKANRAGKLLENNVCNSLERAGYIEVSPKKFDKLKSEGNPIYARQYVVESLSVFNKKIRCDVMIYDPVKHPNSLIIECKYQKTKGTADEKMVYLVENIKLHYTNNTILVVEGEGFREGVVDHYLPNNVGGKFVGFFDLKSFTDLCLCNLI